MVSMNVRVNDAHSDHVFLLHAKKVDHNHMVYDKRLELGGLPYHQEVRWCDLFPLPTVPEFEIYRYNVPTSDLIILWENDTSVS